MGGYQNWRDFELVQITLLLLVASKMLTILHKICKFALLDSLQIVIKSVQAYKNKLLWCIDLVSNLRINVKIIVFEIAFW